MKNILTIINLLQKTAGNAGQKSLQRRLLKEALAQDSSVFQYDEVYDEIQENKSAVEQARKNAGEKKVRNEKYNLKMI